MTPLAVAQSSEMKTLALAQPIPQRNSVKPSVEGRVHSIGFVAGSVCSITLVHRILIDIPPVPRRSSTSPRQCRFKGVCINPQVNASDSNFLIFNQHHLQPHALHCLLALHQQLGATVPRLDLNTPKRIGMPHKSDSISMLCGSLSKYSPALGV